MRAFREDAVVWVGNKMVRHTPGGRLALIDLIMEWTCRGRRRAQQALRKLTVAGLVPCYDKLAVGRHVMIVVTEKEWADVRQHLPCKTHMTKRPPTRVDDLYVMQYGTSNKVVKIGRSSNIEQRRRDLQAGHNFLVTVVASFPSFGHLEQMVHLQLQAFRSTEGVGKEWFNVTEDQAITMIQWVIDNREVSPSFSVVEILPD